MWQDFFIHSSINKYLACFHILAVVHNAEMNMGVHISLVFSLSSNKYPDVELLGHTVVLFLIF